MHMRYDNVQIYIKYIILNRNLYNKLYTRMHKIKFVVKVWLIENIKLGLSNFAYAYIYKKLECGGGLVVGVRGRKINYTACNWNRIVFILFT